MKSDICFLRDGTGNNRTVTFAELADNDSVTIEIAATVNCSVADNALIGNTVTVSLSTPDADTTNNYKNQQQQIHLFQKGVSICKQHRQTTKQ